MIPLPASRGAAAPLLFALFFLCTTIYAGGGRDRGGLSEKPEWSFIVPQSETEQYFVGTSLPFETEAEARDNARQNALNQVLSFYGEVIVSWAKEHGTIDESTRNTLIGYVAFESGIVSYAENVVSQVNTVRYYTETRKNRNKTEYIAYTLCQINKKKANDDIENFAENISKQYASLMAPRDTLKATLEAYAIIIETLEQKPLHRTMAYYEGPLGRSNLYDYTRHRINELLDSVGFEPIPSRIVQRTETILTVVQLRSSEIPLIGPVGCRVTIHGMNNDAPTVYYTIGNDNSFQMLNHTNRLRPGRYSVQIEILLRETSGRFGRNKDFTFDFEITPPNVAVEFQGNFSGRERDIILDAIQTSMREIDMSVRFTQAGSESRHRFVFAGDDEVTSINYIRWKVPGFSLRFMLDNSPSLSKTFNVTETNRDLLIYRTAEAIRQEKQFFLELEEEINRY